ncbi:MAG: hypothetical protein C0524_04740 [Rhodobacter sp.]|nr:hypothetical protein [Rhodobacter sp.]
MSTKVKILGAASALVLGLMAGGAQAEVLFWSTQAQPVEETQKMRESVVAGFEGGVDRGGSVDLNRFRAFSKWFSASVTPPPLRASAG